jgi:hypothetical protein
VKLGKQVTKDEMDKLNIFPSKFHGNWNYTLKPQK